MAISCGDGNVIELHAAVNATKHQASAAHIAAAGKFGREEQPLSENLQQRIDIFGRGDAAQQDDLAGRADLIREQAGVALERNTVAGVGQRDRSRRDPAQVFSGNQRFRGKQAAAGGDHEGAGRMGRRLGEGARIGQLAAEIKAADKRETLSQRQAAVTETKGEREVRVLVKNQPCADAGCVGGREKEDAVDGSWLRVGRSGSAGGSAGRLRDGDS